ncbi:MAG: PaaI family thioesterase [Acidimicrobiales bacterium]
MATEPKPWQEPVRGGPAPAENLGLSGIEALRASISGRSVAPPLAHLFGTRFIEVGPGTATFALPVSPWLIGPHGLVPTGVLAVLADAPMGCALMSELPPASPYTTSELSLTHLRPVRPGMFLTARSQVLQRGRSQGLTDVKVTDEAGRLVAHGTSRLAILARPSPVPERPPAPERPPVPEPSVEPEPAGEPAHDTPDPWERLAVGGALGQEVWDRLDGRQVSEGLLGGELEQPPLHHLTGLRIVEAGDGTAVFALPASGWLTTPVGRVQGGCTAMLADAALQWAILTRSPSRTAVVGVDLKVNFLRPVPPDGGEVVARAAIRHAGRTLAVADAEVIGTDGRPVALARGSAMFLSGRRADLSRT